MSDQETNYPLTSLYLYLSNYCNLCCSHCWISPTFSPRPRDGLPLHSLKETIREAKSLGLQNVKLTGGEPLFYRDLGELLIFLASEGLSISIETNGTLIDRGVLEILTLSRPEQVSVSLDAAHEEIHDEIRGVRGSLSRTLEGLRLLSETDLNLQIIMTLQRKNRGEIPGLIRLSQEVGASSLKINHLLPSGRGKGAFGRKENLEPEELLNLYGMVEGVWARPENLEVLFDLPVAFRSIDHIKRSWFDECRILNILGILANGDFSICGIGQTIEELRMGNLNRDSICDVWEKSPILKDLRESLPKKLRGICGDCIFKFQCLGACRANAYSLTGDLYAPYFLCQELFDSGLFPASRRLDPQEVP